MNILYLSDTRFAAAPYRDASTRYRGYHFAEALIEKQYVADIGVLDVIDTDIIERYDVVIALRPNMSRKLIRVANLCSQHQVKFIADFDDLIFSTNFAGESPQVKNKQATEEQIGQLYKGHADALSLFDKVIASTQELSWHIQELHPSAKVLQLPNGLSDYWLKYNAFVKKIDVIRHGLSNDAVNCSGDITYLPGTRSHDHDFSTAENELAKVLSDDTESRLNIIGALDFNEGLFPAEQLSRGAWTDYMNLPALVANSWVTIAPLAATAFNQSKSHIKFIESAAFGTPHICSNIPDVAQHNIDGLSVVTSTEQWGSEIARYKDRDYYEHCSIKLQDYAREHCMARNSVPELLNFIEESTQIESNEDTVSLSKAS